MKPLTIERVDALSIHQTTTFSGSGEVARTRTVQCPRRGHSVTVSACEGCAAARAVTLRHVRCVTGTEENGQERRVKAADVGEAAVRTPLHEAIRTETLCVRSDVGVESVRRLLLERGLRAAPVVDADGKLIGIVSKSDLLRDVVELTDREELSSSVPLVEGFHEDSDDTRTVADVMTPCAHALPASAPVAHAVALMAIDEIHEVPVVRSEQDGRVVGMFTSLDGLRWLAARLGYVVPSDVDPAPKT